MVAWAYFKKRGFSVLPFFTKTALKTGSKNPALVFPWQTFMQKYVKG